jgi:hypothetical protein
LQAQNLVGFALPYLHELHCLMLMPSPLSLSW